MRLIGLAVVLAFGFALVPVEAQTQQAGKGYRVRSTDPGAEPPPSSAIPYLGPFRQGLADSGYVEGRNIYFAYRWGGGDPRILPKLAKELVRVGVDVLFATSTPAIHALMGVTTTIPI